jgi:hypothetical protein
VLTFTVTSASPATVEAGRPLSAVVVGARVMVIGTVEDVLAV